jgi:hypothetical protein
MILGIIVPVIFLVELGVTVLAHFIISRVRGGQSRKDFSWNPYCRCEGPFCDFLVSPPFALNHRAVKLLPCVNVLGARVVMRSLQTLSGHR